MATVNSVTLIGNLTRDPELRYTPSGSPVCNLRIAVNEWVKDQGERPNYFDITVWGGQAEASAEHLKKGRQVGVQGRLHWREWEAKDGTKRQAVDVVANVVMFLGSPAGDTPGKPVEPEPDAMPADTSGLPSSQTVPSSAAGSADDVPF